MMGMTTALLALAAATVTSATNLFVSDYAGNITSFALTENHGNYSLAQTFQNTVSRLTCIHHREHLRHTLTLLPLASRNVLPTHRG